MSDTTTTSNDSGIIEEDFDPQTGEVLEPEVHQPQSAGALVVQDAINRLQSGNVSVYSTVVGDDFEAKKTVLNAVTNAVPLQDNIGKHIDLVNVVVQSVELNERDGQGNYTGQMITAPRVILIDADGTAYYGISPVLLKGLETFMGVLGQPSTWPEGGVGMKVTREKARVGSFYNMVLDNPPKTAAKR